MTRASSSSPAPGLAVAANLVFALAADGFWSALLWRGLAGVGLAGTYMPGLRVLTDRDDSAEKSRAVTFYTASYSVGVSLSFLFTGLLAGIFGWRIGFALLALGPLVALAIALFCVAGHRPKAGPRRPLFNFRPVFANRRALGYILAYSAHGYELTAMRAWMVAFLGFAATARGIGEDHGATAIAAVFSVIGLPASVLGNELSVRFGRRRVLIAIMTVSAVLGAVIGFSPGLPYRNRRRPDPVLRRHLHGGFGLSHLGRHLGLAAGGARGDHRRLFHLGICRRLHRPALRRYRAGSGRRPGGGRGLDRRLHRDRARRLDRSAGALASRQRARLLSALGAGMGLLIDGQQSGGIHLGVALGGRERGMAQQLLDRAQIAAAGQEMGGEAVAQRMRRGRHRQPEQQAQALQAVLHDARMQRPAARAQEQRLMLEGAGRRDSRRGRPPRPPAPARRAACAPCR